MIPVCPCLGFLISDALFSGVPGDAERGAAEHRCSLPSGRPGANNRKKKSEKLPNVSVRDRYDLEPRNVQNPEPEAQRGWLGRTELPRGWNGSVSVCGDVWGSSSKLLA